MFDGVAAYGTGGISGNVNPWVSTGANHPITAEQIVDWAS